MKLKGIVAVSVIIVAALVAMRPADDPKSPTAPATKARLRLPSKDAPFWNTAVVPEPLIARLPSAVVMGPNPTPVDHPSEVARLLRIGDTQKLNFAIAAWFDADASAARDWLAAQESMSAYEPALIIIAGKIAHAGDPAHALEWAALLTPGPAQEQSLFDIYATAARGHRFTESQLKSAPLPAARVDELLSGAAGD